MNRRVALALLLSAVGCTVASPSSEPSSEPVAESALEAALDAPAPRRLAPWQLDKRRHGAPDVLATDLRKPLARAAAVPLLTPAPLLTYQNGPLIDSVEIYAVYWGAKVDPTTTAGLPGFFQSISSDAPYVQMLTEYNVSSYVLGHGTFKAGVVDAQAPAGVLDTTTNTFTVQDQEVQAELSRLVDVGALPAPNGHNIFMVYFDAQTLVGQGTCTSFCAYHNSFTRNAAPVYYAIMPDLGHNGCEMGCGFNTVLNNLYSASSHELVEAMTDADVGNNNLAWIDTGSGNEIGDICPDWDGTASGYNVQSQWSNESNGCRDHRPATVASGSISSADVTVAPGGKATFNITTSGTATGPWTLELKDYVITTGNKAATPEYPFTFTPATVSPGGSAQLTVSVPANETTFGFGALGYQLRPHIAATDADGVHRFVEVNLNVVTAAPKLTKITPATGPTLGGTSVVATGSSFASDAQGYFCPATGACDPATNAVAVVNGTVSADGKSFAFRTPDHSAGATRFMLLNPADSARPAFIKFTFTVGKNTAPSIASVAPTSGPTAGGTQILITGKNFDQGVAGGGGAAVPNLALSIGGVALTAQSYFVIDAKHISAATPAHAAGAVAIKVTNADKQTATRNNAFTYGTGNAPASGLSLATTMGPTAGGTYVVINGDNILPGVTVTFGGSAATVKSVNASFLGVVSPPHAAGAVPVVVTNPGAPASKPLTFTYVAAPPPDMTTLNDLTVVDDLSQAIDLGQLDALDAGADDLGASAADLATGGGGGHGGSGGGGGGHGGGCSVANGGAPASSAPLWLALIAIGLGLRRRRV